MLRKRKIEFLFIYYFFQSELLFSPGEVKQHAACHARQCKKSPSPLPPFSIRLGSKRLEHFNVTIPSQNPRKSKQEPELRN